MSVKDKLVELIFGSLCKHIHKSCNLAENIADDLIANDVTVQQWIPVSERLPEESGEYLTYCGEYDGICVLYCEVLKTKIKWRTKWKEVTYWQPLPEPPKEEA